MNDRTPSRPRLSRRNLMKTSGLSGLGLALGPGLAACGRGFGGGDDSSGGEGEINMVWWGDAARAEVTEAALDIFTEETGIAVKTEYQDSGPYQDKLATRFAAGDEPDLMAQRMDSLREFADRGALLDLNTAGDAVDLSGLSESARALAEVDGAVYGVPAGLNAIGFIVNRDITDEHGIAIPDGDTWSWDDLAEFSASVTEATGGEVYGTGFEASTLANIIVWIRQQGEDFFTEDGRFGASEASVQAWFDMIQAMRDAGGFPPAGFFEQVGGGAEQSYIAAGTLASQIIPTNNFLSYSQAAGGNLALLRMPGETTGVRRGQSVDCPHLWSIASASEHQDEALRLLDFLANDPRASQATGTTRGVPPNSQIAEDLMGDLAEEDRTATEYLIGLQGEDLPPSFPYPPGGSAIADALAAIATEVEFGSMSSSEAAAAFVAQSQDALEQ
ncbi:ABC transporter substrate-binding protein [Glycomyces tenuis]|uniref:ABC transporter substrate-binding protein n=1 Tax=Glycomyces tenuis TaxID=58116 RepID=UPI000422DD97|nr:extracellular solute-binding protein [Glycomyces tenuis]